HENVDELTDIPDLQRSLIMELSIVVTEFDEKLKPMLHGNRSDSGIVVVAQTGGTNSVNTGVERGDIIRAINRTPLESVSQLQAIARKLKSGDPVVLQVERAGKMQYLSFEMD